MHLATANIQATRLQFLELRVDRLENPDTPPLGAQLISLGQTVLEQLIVVGAIEVVAGAVIAVGFWLPFQNAASKIASRISVAQRAIGPNAEVIALNEAKDL